MTILFGGIFAVFGMLALNGLPMPYHPVFNVPRFAFATEDKFFLVVFSSDPRYNPAKSAGFWKAWGRAPSRRCPIKRALHAGMRKRGLARFRPAAGSGRARPACIALLRWRDAGRTCTTSPASSRLPNSDFYGDLRSARPQVEGTVARRQLHEDTYLYTGKLGNDPGDYLPFPGHRRCSRPRDSSAMIFTAPPATPAWATAMA